MRFRAGCLRCACDPAQSFRMILGQVNGDRVNGHHAPLRTTAMGAFSVNVPVLLRAPVRISSEAATRMAAVRVIATSTTGDFMDVLPRADRFGCSQGALKAGPG